jgi:hypothetical protein
VLVFDYIARSATLALQRIWYLTYDPEISVPTIPVGSAVLSPLYRCKE